MQVLVADRHPLFREVLRDVVAEALASSTIVEAQSYAEAEDMVSRSEDLGLALVDLSLSGNEGLTGLLRLSMLRPGIPIILIAANDSPDLVRRALVCGASGFLPKSLAREQMSAEIRAATGPHHGDEGERLDTLTLRERTVLESMVRGRSNKMIAYELQISCTTVKVHVRSILRKLRVRTRIQAIIAMRDRCLEDGS